MTEGMVRDLLFQEMSFGERKVEGRLAERWLREMASEPGLDLESPLGEQSVVAERLYGFLTSRIQKQLEALHGLRHRYAEYVKRYSRATDPVDAERHILDFARDLGGSSRQLRGDRRAFSRWFGHDAICERYFTHCGILEREMTFGLKRSGVVVAHLMSMRQSPSDVGFAWTHLGFEQRLTPFFTHDGDPRVATAAVSSLARALRGVPGGIQRKIVDDSTLQFVYRCAMHSRLDTWLQCEALGILDGISSSCLLKVLRQRLSNQIEGDDIFVRRRAVLVLMRNVRKISSLAALLSTVVADPSPFVRQGMAESLTLLPKRLAEVWFRRLTGGDASPQVRGVALLTGLKLLERPLLRDAVLSTVLDRLREEKEDIALRVTLHVAAEAVEALVLARAPDAAAWGHKLIAALETIHTGAGSVATRRQAAQARERIWCSIEPEARRLRDVLDSTLKTFERSETQRVSRDLIPASSPDILGRVLSVVSQGDFGYDASLDDDWVRITRGEIFRFRLWRMLYELRNPSPDKRQAHRHTIGRHFHGSVRAPSSILCELAETRIPGEPLFIPEEGGWRPFLPLLDDCISTLGVSGKTVRLYSSEGITEISPPDSLRRRLVARLRIAHRFPELAKLRNWRPQWQDAPTSYLDELGHLGLVVRHQPHADLEGRPVSLDPEVSKFFPAALPFADSELYERVREYFFSVYGNTLFDLALFAGAASALFVGRHILSSRSIQRARAAIPLVIGGWGTRGKSGTERLKAALLNALGYGIVSKTTGCEAMFLYAPPFGQTREMFLFRSYDKATIWEQHHVMRLATRLGTDVFLWECMALTPSYVDILQRHWVRDDLSTVTNTYPDHEDLQGPAGYDIPGVISIFTPRRGTLVTTEEVMLPILAEESRRKETRLKPVTWIEPSLLAPDVLKRFPYDEHPNNIALVLSLADELGVPRDFALKEMADRVVPDLGVLKTSPIAPIEGRRLQFINGMSANERHGALSNWARCGLDKQDPVAEPHVWISTVVNNRADRIPRSKVFARVLVEDISADAHFLIGGNLSGLVGYIHQAWESYSGNLSLRPEGSPASPTEVLASMAKRLRIPTERSQVLGKLEAMVTVAETPESLLQELDSLLEKPEALKEKLDAAGLVAHSESILEHHTRNLRTYGEYAAFLKKVVATSPESAGALDDEFRRLLEKWFHARIVVVEDYHISGEQLIHLIARKTPPGFLNRIMGIQNIKGTGLDFVYRWQAWDACHRACCKIEDEDELVVDEGLKLLASFREYGVLSREHVGSTLARVKAVPTFQKESRQAELAMITSAFEFSMKELAAKLRVTRKKSSRMEKIISSIEAVFDAGDAVKRRKLANRVYRDMAWQRISVERAAGVLKGINKRQKGGWLYQKLTAARQLVVRNLSHLLMRGAK